MLVRHGRKGEKKDFREKGFASLLDAAHQQLGGNIVLVWENNSHHVDAAMRELIEKRPWLAVYRFPTYTPDLNPAEGVRAHLKKSLGNLALYSIDDLAGLVRRMRSLEHGSDVVSVSVDAARRGWSRPRHVVGARRGRLTMGCGSASSRCCR
jgi:putative transposase